MMTILPFICLGIGAFIGFRELTPKVLKIADAIVNIALVLLMLTIGMNIGINDSVMSSLAVIGFNCAVIALLAIAGSVVCVVIVEKTVLPLEKIRVELQKEKMLLTTEHQEQEKNKISPLVLIMPLSIIAGVLVGYFFLPEKQQEALDKMLIASLIVLYTGVGISLGSNRKVFQYVKQLGIKILWISVGILAGSLIGGMLAGILLDLPLRTAVISAGGMSYYSITGAFMTERFGIETGTYGFVVNVMREFFTVVSLPAFFKISKGSPIAAGAAGNMDTMLMPVTKFVGAELGLVALITGTILTFAVPLILPLLGLIFAG